MLMIPENVFGTKKVPFDILYSTLLQNIEVILTCQNINITAINEFFHSLLCRFFIKKGLSKYMYLLKHMKNFSVFIHVNFYLFPNQLFMC